MALTYVFAAMPATGTASSLGTTPFAPAGNSYTPNSAGIITGVTPGDARTLSGQGGTLTLLCAVGATADRPTGASYTAAGPNQVEPAPYFNMPMWDSTLSKMIFFRGSLASTGWVDQTGTAV